VNDYLSNLYKKLLLHVYISILHIQIESNTNPAVVFCKCGSSRLAKYKYIYLVFNINTYVILIIYFILQFSNLTVIQKGRIT